MKRQIQYTAAKLSLALQWAHDPDPAIAKAGLRLAKTYAKSLRALQARRA